MLMLMCRSCGKFTPAKREDGGLIPLRDECSNCGGTEFRDNETGTIVQTEIPPDDDDADD